MQDAWSLAEKACYAMLHVRALFLSDAEMVMLVNSVLAASYRCCEYDCTSRMY